MTTHAINDPVAEHFARWLTVGSGCFFAARFARGPTKRISFATIVTSVDSLIASELTEHFRAAASENQAAIAIFPELNNEDRIVELLRSLAASDRWRCKRVRHEPNTDVRLALDWRTDHDQWSGTMGFAPLTTMPITRRAPYVAIAAWTGPARRADAAHVGFIDMPSKLNKELHRQLRDRSRDRTGTLLGNPEEAARWRSTTFALSAQVEELTQQWPPDGAG